VRIAEIFRSLQGEGRLTGTDAVFIRTSGCLLHCRFCDTRYASWEPEGEELSVDDVLARIEQIEREVPAHLRDFPGASAKPQAAGGVRHAVLTGGEPMLFPETIGLCAELRRHGKHVTVETAGTIYRRVECDLMSISPKLSNSTPLPEQSPRGAASHDQSRFAPEVIRRLAAEYDCQFKFVVDRPEDCDEVQRCLAGLPEIDRSRVMLMPQGTTAEVLAEKALWLAPYCAEHGLGFCPRRQIEWFGARRGT
jgi:7-carboxy-7-deazaguanine synthase